MAGTRSTAAGDIEVTLDLDPRYLTRSENSLATVSFAKIEHRENSVCVTVDIVGHRDAASLDGVATALSMAPDIADPVLVASTSLEGRLDRADRIRILMRAAPGAERTLDWKITPEERLSRLRTALGVEDPPHGR